MTHQVKIENQWLMGVEREFKKVKLFSGVIYSSSQVYEETKKKLEDIFFCGGPGIRRIQF